MFSDLSWLGVLACIYALARLIYYAYLRLEDSNRHPILQWVLVILCFILYSCSAPVTLIMGIINMMHFRRLEDKVRADCSEDPSSHNYHKNTAIPLELISVFMLVVVICSGFRNNRLVNEVEMLETQIEETGDEYNNGYEAGFEAARKEYFDEGYNEGYSDGVQNSEKISYESGYEDGVQDGYSGAHEEGYEEGYTIGYGHALIDYCDISIRDRVITGMLDFDSYADIYEWLIGQRPVSVDN